jgi:hypothetical protein
MLGDKSCVIATWSTLNLTLILGLKPKLLGHRPAMEHLSGETQNKHKSSFKSELRTGVS